jgi:hypothetical protein
LPSPESITMEEQAHDDPSSLSERKCYGESVVDHLPRKAT